MQTSDTKVPTHCEKVECTLAGAGAVSGHADRFSLEQGAKVQQKKVVVMV